MWWQDKPQIVYDFMDDMGLLTMNKVVPLTQNNDSILAVKKNSLLW